VGDNPMNAQSQESLEDQLKELCDLANKHGLYDAADKIKTLTEKQDSQKDNYSLDDKKLRIANSTEPEREDWKLIYQWVKQDKINVDELKSLTLLTIIKSRIKKQG
jgi:hypothetical protein